MKINCPAHEDKTPSLHCYEDYAWCFVCGYRCKTEEVLNAEEIEKLKKEKPEKEDIEETIKYIETVPKMRVRGLSLPASTSGFYVVWPDKNYFIKRLFGNDTRYLYPIGHKPIPYKIERSKEVLVVVEGVVNLLSLDYAFGDSRISLFSPGSAGSLEGYIDYYCQYRHIVLVVDRDPTGIACGDPLKKELLKRKKRVTLIAVEPDFNETLQQGGPEAVKQQFMEELGL